MTPDALGIVERLFKAVLFVPVMALIAWWIFTNWLDRTLSLREAAVGLALLAVAFTLGVSSIVVGGWSFVSVLAGVYLAVLALAGWEYTYWRRRERQDLVSEIAGYQAAIEKDPTNAAAHSFLGEAHLRLRNFEQAEEALQKALELDPESGRDRKLLRMARERRSRMTWWRVD